MHNDHLSGATRLGTVTNLVLVAPKDICSIRVSQSGKLVTRSSLYCLVMACEVTAEAQYGPYEKISGVQF